MEFGMQTVQKIFSQGGQKFSWGGTQNLFDGGQALMGRYYPLMGEGVPPILPILASPG